MECEPLETVYDTVLRSIRSPQETDICLFIIILYFGHEEQHRHQGTDTPPPTEVLLHRVLLSQILALYFKTLIFLKLIIWHVLLPTDLAEILPTEVP